MEFANIVAKVFGIYLVVSGLFLILKGKTLPLLLKDFFEHRAITFLAGAVLVFLGAVMIVKNNIWNSGWRNWVTVLGWLALLKGSAYILIPETLAKIKVKPFRPWLGILGLVAIALGVYLFRIG